MIVTRFVESGQAVVVTAATAAVAAAASCLSLAARTTTLHVFRSPSVHTFRTPDRQIDHYLDHLDPISGVCILSYITLHTCIPFILHTFAKPYNTYVGGGGSGVCRVMSS